MSAKFLKKIGKLSNINDSIRILRYVLYPTGLLPFFFDTSDSTYKISRIQPLISALNFVIFLICYLVALSDEKKLSESYFKSEVSQHLSIVYSVIPLLSATFLFLMSFIQKSDLLGLMNNFYKLDKRVRVNYSQIRMFICTRVTFLVLFQIFSIVAYAQNLKRMASFPIIITFALPPFSIWLYVLTYITLVHLIKSFLSEISNQLRILRGVSPSGYCLVEMNNVKSEKLIAEARDLYDLLFDTSQILQRYYGWKILIIIGLSFIYIISEIYYILEVIFSPFDFEELNKGELVAFTLAMVISYGFQILAIIEVCNSALEENNSVIVNAHKLLHVTYSPHVKEKLVFFVMQWANRPLELTAAGLFKLDRTMYFTVGLLAVLLTT